uniref:hypothetical protein n=1 Tax=Acinetobacter baumannii TaxID=470 RepID=UPI001BB2E107
LAHPKTRIKIAMHIITAPITAKPTNHKEGRVLIFIEPPLYKLIKMAAYAATSLLITYAC